MKLIAHVVKRLKYKDSSVRGWHHDFIPPSSG